MKLTSIIVLGICAALCAIGGYVQEQEGESGGGYYTAAAVLLSTIVMLVSR